MYRDSHLLLLRQTSRPSWLLSFLSNRLARILLFQLSQPFFIHLQDILVFLSILLEPRNSMNKHEHYVPIVLRDRTYDNSRLRLSVAHGSDKASSVLGNAKMISDYTC